MFNDQAAEILPALYGFGQNIYILDFAFAQVNPGSLYSYLSVNMKVKPMTQNHIWTGQL